MSGLKRRLHQGRARKGTAIVEMALVSPVLFLFIFGLLELGRI
ncbi:MAG: TadE/TadG family type IV pilus assembly protein, partial [Patescibacteria group bacterium]|nr:TadE/TadG family type IV pilus assembly protein [Patescibacteria group bacterium]